MTKKRLGQKAMLVQLSHSFWTGRIKDRRVSEEVRSNKGAKSDSGAWWTYLISRKDMKDVYHAINKARAIHSRLTLPWNDDGCRILPAAMFMDYSEEMRKAESDFKKAVEAFLKEYPNILKNSRKRLGNLLNHVTLPTIIEIRKKFGVSQNIYPLPDSSDFRVDLAEGDVDAIKKEMTKSINGTIEKAMASVWEHLAELIEKVESTLGEPKKVFRDSLISNLKDFCELIPKLNLTDDSKLESIRKDTLAKLADLRPDVLRDSKDERKQAHKTAKAVLKKLKEYGM